MSSLDQGEERGGALAWFLEAAPDPMLVLDGDRIVLVNTKLERLLGYGHGELLGAPLDILVPERVRAAHRAHVAAYHQAPTPRAMGERSALFARHRDGRELPVEISLSPMATTGRALVLAAVREVSAQRALLAELAASRTELQALLAANPDFVLYLDRAGRIRFVNRVPPELSGVDPIGAPWQQQAPPAHHADIAAGLARVHERGEVVELEVVSPGPGGEPGWFSCHLGPIYRDREVVGAVVVLRDVTARKRAESRLAESDRMATVGMLAAGVAHEINNPLAAAMIAIELAHEAAATEPALAAVQQTLADARLATERIRAIVHDLRLFSRAAPEPVHAVDVNQVVESSLRLARAELRHRARVVTELRPVPAVSATETQLGQVVINLLANAAQAFTTPRDTDEVAVRTGTAPDGRVVIEVADTGAGMTAEVRARLFTPFFTTKPAGVGTGLGLAISHRLVTAMGGEITVASEPGRGSTFRILLPARPVAPAPDPAVTGAAPSPRRGRILVVDDDPTLTTLLARTLSDEHDVVAVHTVAAALACVGDDPSFDLILSDLMMPGRSGLDLRTELDRRAPHLVPRLAFITGGVFSAADRERLERCQAPILEKPFALSDLLRFVAAHLG